MNRRGLITGLGALFVAAPAIVRAASIMPVKVPFSDDARLQKFAEIVRMIGIRTANPNAGGYLVPVSDYFDMDAVARELTRMTGAEHFLVPA